MPDVNHTRVGFDHAGARSFLPSTGWSASNTENAGNFCATPYNPGKRKRGLHRSNDGTNSNPTNAHTHAHRMEHSACPEDTRFRNERTPAPPASSKHWQTRGHGSSNKYASSVYRSFFSEQSKQALSALSRAQRGKEVSLGSTNSHAHGAENSQSRL